MRLVLLTGPGKLSINYQWLPTWLGINRESLAAIEGELKEKAVGLVATDETLDELDELVIETLVAKYPVEGLRDFLDGLKFIRIDQEARPCALLELVRRMAKAKLPYLTIRIDKELREKMHDYARRRGTNLTEITLSYFLRLLKEEERQEAEQL